MPHCITAARLINAMLMLRAVGLPDLDGLLQLIKRIQEILVMGGVTLALTASFIFLLAWVLSHLRSPSTKTSHPVVSTAAMLLGYVPVALTLVAALGLFAPGLAPMATLQSFALAVVIAAFTWWVAVAAIVVGGSRQNLSRARKALLLSGTPWYCLAIYLSTYL